MLELATPTSVHKTLLHYITLCTYTQGDSDVISMPDYYYYYYYFYYYYYYYTTPLLMASFPEQPR